MLRALPVSIAIAAGAFGPADVASTPATLPVAPETAPAYRHEVSADGTVQIIVGEKDLALCRLTLAMVMSPVVVDESGNVVGHETVSEAAPPAVCVVGQV
jgi:hypothetical protein